MRPITNPTASSGFISFAPSFPRECLPVHGLVERICSVLLTTSGQFVNGHPREPRSFSRVHAAFPAGLLDRAFYARVQDVPESESPFLTGFSQALTVKLKLLMESTLE